MTIRIGSGWRVFVFSTLILIWSPSLADTHKRITCCSPYSAWQWSEQKGREVRTFLTFWAAIEFWKMGFDSSRIFRSNRGLAIAQGSTLGHSVALSSQKC